MIRTIWVLPSQSEYFWPKLEVTERIVMLAGDMGPEATLPIDLG